MKATRERFAVPPYLSRTATALLFCQALAVAAAEQESAPRVDPRVFGLNIPPAAVRPGDGQCVTLKDDEENDVTAKIHVDVGDYRIVLMPDGKLVARPKRETRLTEKPFEPASMDQLAKRLTGTTFKGFKTDQSSRYLFVYNTSDTFAEVAKRILNSMYPGIQRVIKRQRIETHEPEVPLVVIMFRTEDEFQRYRKMPAGVLAYYHITSNHVVMYEKARRPPLKPEMAVRQAISMIAHEGAHQILHNIGVQQRLSAWPIWLTEGLAEYFAPTSTTKSITWKGAGKVNDMRMFELERFLKLTASDDRQGKAIEETVLAARLSSTGYASAWSLTHYFATKRRLEFYKLMREMSQLGPLEGYARVQGGNFVPQNLEVFKRIFGDDFADMERLLVLHLRALPYTPPFAEYPHFVARIQYGQGRQLKRDARLFLSQQIADQWRQEALNNLTAEQRQTAQSDVRPYRNRPFANQAMQLFLKGQ